MQTNSRNLHHCNNSDETGFTVYKLLCRKLIQTVCFLIIKIEEPLGAIKYLLQGLTLTVDTLLWRESTQKTNQQYAHLYVENKPRITQDAA